MVLKMTYDKIDLIGRRFELDKRRQNLGQELDFLEICIQALDLVINDEK